MMYFWTAEVTTEPQTTLSATLLLNALNGNRFHLHHTYQGEGEKGPQPVEDVAGLYKT